MRDIGDVESRQRRALSARKMRVLVVGTSYDFSDVDFDGFVDRHRLLIDGLRADMDVFIWPWRLHDDGFAVAEKRWRNVTVLDECTLERLGTRKVDRVRRLAAVALGRPSPFVSEARVRAVLESIRPDCALTLGPWLCDELAPVHASVPSVHLFEEDLRNLQEFAPQSPHARAFRHLEDRVRGVRSPSPKRVVVISAAEEQGAQRRYRRAPVETLPYMLDDRYWRKASEPSVGDAVLATGVFVQERNAEGLAEVLAEIATRPSAAWLRVRILSDTGLHPMLEPFLGSTFVDLAPSGTDLRGEYRRARLALVPAKRATGVKTTILQSWVSGCPVVTFDGSARTVGKERLNAMAVGSTAMEVTDHLERLWDDASEREDLVRRGLSAVICHSGTDGHRRLKSMLLAAASRRAASEPTPHGLAATGLLPGR